MLARLWCIGSAHRGIYPKLTGSRVSAGSGELSIRIRSVLTVGVPSGVTYRRTSIRSSILETGRPPRSKTFLATESPSRKSQGGRTMAWACPRCTFLNQGGGVVCRMCALDSPQPVVDSGPEWSCRICTFLNPFVESSCEMCNSARPELAELERSQSIGDGAQSVGKFRPFRGSRRRNAEKESSQESADVSSQQAAAKELRSSAKDSTMMSRKRKSEDAEDEDSSATEMDVNIPPRERQGSVEGEVSNALLSRLHSERMARINSGMASSDPKKSSQQNVGQASGLAPDSSVQWKSAATAGPCLNVDVDRVSILTYNVWFREDLELQARMNAIGNIIQLRHPDVICFQNQAEANILKGIRDMIVQAPHLGEQEVTPDIYSIFQKSSWWSLYKCSVTPAWASKRAYFCMQLSRLSVSSFHRNPYSNSIMGRELSMTDVNHGEQQLVVATTHLESPCPAPPTWNQMFSKERVAQVNEALKLMKRMPNVVFGGDMNWDDKLDGPPPLPPDWVDAWVELHPNEPGLTYDSKANPMLAGSRLQKRLDRMFCHLRDFKIENIEMVGTQAIAGLSYQKERKVKGQIQLASLPVLPSDHFGLLLQLQRVHV